MAFCGKCGNKLIAESKYCPECGASVSRNKSDASRTNGSSNPVVSSVSQDKRKEVVDGVIHKCPNCGGAINGFNVKCALCGYEIRRENPMDTVEMLSRKLQSLEASRKNPGKFESVASAYGLPTSSQKVYAAKANLISSYVIPNTKEDILEFMVLASSNIVPSIVALKTIGNGNYYQERDMKIEQDAWVSKMQQAYQKAAFSFAHDAEFPEIKRIFNSKMEEIEREKKSASKALKLYIGLVVSILLVFCVLIPVGAGIAYSVGEKNNKKEIEKEISRLEEIVDEIEDDIDDGDYASALRRTRRLHYNGPNSSRYEEEWDEIREGYIEEINDLQDSD